MPEIGCRLDKPQWIDVFKLIRDTFRCSETRIQIITRRETVSIRIDPSSNNEHYVENEMENYTNEWATDRHKPETDFTRDSKSCQPPCTEQFPILRPKQLNGDLIDCYLQ